MTPKPQNDPKLTETEIIATRNVFVKFSVNKFLEENVKNNQKGKHSMSRGSFEERNPFLLGKRPDIQTTTDKNSKKLGFLRFFSPMFQKTWWFRMFETFNNEPFRYLKGLCEEMNAVFLLNKQLK